MKRAGLAHANLTKTHRTIGILGIASPGGPSAPRAHGPHRTFQRPTCPHCRSEMMLARIETTSALITSGPPNYDIRTFECPRCSRILRKAVKLEDPMKNDTTMNWLHGQLIPPNASQATDHHVAAQSNRATEMKTPTGALQSGADQPQKDWHQNRRHDLPEPE